MRLSDIKTILHAEVLWGEEHLDREVFSACGSDFMSDVLAFVKNQALLLTGLVNPQVVRTADMVAVSYTHLDVYKRQMIPCTASLTVPLSTPTTPSSSTARL